MIEQAKLYALANSHDPDTQVGAVIRERGVGLYVLGTNHVPRGVDRRPERLSRPEKYDFMLHAEIDAIIASAGLDTGHNKGVDMYLWASRPIHPCAACALAIVRRGVKTLYVAPMQWQDEPKYSFSNARQILAEGGVEVIAL